MDIFEPDEVILYNHVAFIEAANYLSELSKDGHVSFHSSQESRLHQVTGMYNENPHFLGAAKEQAKMLTPLLRMLVLHVCHVDGSFADGLVHPVIESKNVPCFEHVHNYGPVFEIPQEKAKIQKFLSLFDRLFVPHKVLKLLGDFEKGNNNDYQVNGGMLFINNEEFLLLRCQMEEAEVEQEVEQEVDDGMDVPGIGAWNLVASVSTGKLHDRLDEVTKKLRDIFIDPTSDV